MIISVLILAVFAVAAGVLLFSTPVDAVPETPVESPSINDPDDGLVSLPGFVEQPPTPSPEPSPVIVTDINTITVRHGTAVWNNESFTISASRPTEEFNFTIEPVGFDVADDFNIEYISTNTEVFEVTEVITGQAGRYGFRATRIGRGNGTLRIVITNNGKELVWSTIVYSS